MVISPNNQMFQSATQLSNFLDNLAIHQSKVYTVQVPAISPSDQEKSEQIYKTWEQNFYGHVDGDEYIQGNLAKMLKEAASCPDT